MKRRSFLKSLVAAVALSSVFSGFSFEVPPSMWKNRRDDFTVDTEVISRIDFETGKKVFTVKTLVIDQKDMMQKGIMCIQGEGGKENLGFLVKQMENSAENMIRKRILKYG